MAYALNWFLSSFNDFKIKYAPYKKAIPDTFSLLKRTLSEGTNHINRLRNINSFFPISVFISFSSNKHKRQVMYQAARPVSSLRIKMTTKGLYTPKCSNNLPTRYTKSGSKLALTWLANSHGNWLAMLCPNL